MAKETTALRVRWTPELVERSAQAFQEGRIFTPFAPVTDGNTAYQDLRGLPIHAPIRDLTFDRVDLSHARFEQMGQFVDVTAANCIFVGAKLDTNLSGTYQQCRFDSTNLSGATIFGGTTFSDCTFVRADLKRAKGGKIRFERCDFTSANFRATQFLSCVFKDCLWRDALFFHTSLGGSTISRSGFPIQEGHQDPEAILPDVILDNVKWLE